MNNFVIPHSRPFVTDSDTQAVVSVIESGQLAQGPKVGEFELRLADFIGKKQGVATSSGTAALHLALLALDVQEGDEVIIPSFVCTAVLNAVNYTRATACLADIDPLTYNISSQSVAEKITDRTKAIIVPHLFGYPALVDKLSGLGIPLIEDCAQSVGAHFRGRKVGSYGLLSVFSFYATKMITSGEGGMVLCDSEALISKIRDLRDYDDREDYVLRFNYKMTDIQAALGKNQLDRLEEFIGRRREIASRFIQEFKDFPLVLPLEKEGGDHIYYRFVVKTNLESSVFLNKLQAEGILCRRPVFAPLHILLGLSGFPHTSDAWEKTVSIPIYPSLSDEEVERIISVVKRTFSY